MLFPCLKFFHGTPLHLGLFQGFSAASQARHDMIPGSFSSFIFRIFAQSMS